MKTVTSYQMHLMDKMAQERFNIPSITLMENAGRASSFVAMDMLNIKRGDKQKKRVAVFCGKGNNGGDGFVVSRYLTISKIDTTTYMLCGEDELKKDPATNLKLLKKLDAKIVVLKEKDGLLPMKELSNYNLIIDAIFGTGFKGSPKGLVSELINLINASGVKVLSIDVPSGLDATTGRCEGTCIKAAQTVTFGLPKTGFYKLDGPKCTGRINVKNIGFPKSLISNPPPILRDPSLRSG